MTRDLFNWIFPPLVQAELDEFCLWWNQHRVRHQADKNMPSGHVPIDVLENPELYCGTDCRVRIPPTVVQELREDLTEEGGTRESHVNWVSDDFSAIADDVYKFIGTPRISFPSAWHVFKQMSDVMGELDL